MGIMSKDKIRKENKENKDTLGIIEKGQDKKGIKGKVKDITGNIEKLRVKWESESNRAEKG